MLRTKQQMYRELFKGRFGNTQPFYTSLEAFKRSADPSQLYGVRWFKVNAPTIYNLTFNQVVNALDGARADFVIQPMLGDEHTIFQGEVIRDPDLRLHYSTVPAPMKIALRDGINVRGVIANEILKCYLDPPSYDDLISLLDDFPNHVVEFTTQDRKIGNCGRNTVFWEVRSY